MSQKMWKGQRVLLIIVWTAVSALAANAVRLGVEKQGAAAASQNPVVPGPPVLPIAYTVGLREGHKLASGEEQPGGEYIVAVRADGSFMHRSSYLAPNKANKRAIKRSVTFASGLHVEIDEIRQITTTTVDATVWNYRTNLRDPRTQCARNYEGAVFRRDQVADGITTLAGHATIAIVAGDTKTWFALDLGCALVQLESGASPNAVTRQEAFMVEPGNPPAALFELPAGFKEVPPSVFMSMQAGSSAAKSADASYQAHRPVKRDLR